jgi:hypothetical protein
LTCINVTPDQIVVREAQRCLLRWTPEGPEAEGPLEFDEPAPGRTEKFLADTIIAPLE